MILVFALSKEKKAGASGIIVVMKTLIKPKKLKRGDTVGIIAPSDAVERRFVQNGIRILESWGLKAKLGEHLYSHIGDFAAGSPAERRGDIVRMVEDPEIRAVWCATGGYAATEVLPVFTKEFVLSLKQNPKWFIGYSDSCVILNSLYSFKFTSIHGPNLAGLADWDEKTRQWLKSILFGEKHLQLGSNANWKTYISGKAKGRLFTSNLDALVTLFGTRYDPLTKINDDIILGIEEWWVEKSTLQRQIDTILNHKKADQIKGIILGRFQSVGEESYPDWGKRVTPEMLIESRVRLQKPNIPLVSLLDFGHVNEKNWFEKNILKKTNSFYAIPNGINAELFVDSSSSTLTFLESITS